MNWCLSYIILYVPSGSSLLQGLQAFGTRFETWTDYKGLELSGCFKSTILDRFLQEWLNMEHTPFLLERENSGSQSAVIHLSVGLGAEIFPTFSKIQWNSGCWSDLAPNFPRLNGFTNLTQVSQSCRVSQPLVGSHSGVTQITDCFLRCSPPLLWVVLMGSVDNISIHWRRREKNVMKVWLRFLVCLFV